MPTGQNVDGQNVQWDERSTEKKIEWDKMSKGHNIKWEKKYKRNDKRSKVINTDGDIRSDGK
jgi:hypothetical protein